MTAVAPAAVAPTRVTRSAPRNLASGLTDAAFVTILGGLGLIGFQPIYGGSAYLVAGFAGLILGIAVTELAGRLRQPVLAEAVIVVLAFLLLGGATTTVRNYLPSVASIDALSHAGIYGWKQLLTTAPPVGNSSNLLALPYIIGLVSGLAGQSLARRTRHAALPLLGPAVALVLGILFGARQPESLLLQGTVFACLALIWTTVRFQRTRTSLSGPRASRNRLVLSAGILLVVGLLGGVVGPHLPGANSHPRVVLTRYVAPPFEADQQPSPLAGFRQYVKQGPLFNQVLFSVTGLAPGTEMRIATMDAYDGVAWGFGSSGPATGAGGDVFRHYGSVIQTGATGQQVSATVTLGQLGGTWVPEVGELSGISFSGSGNSQLTAAFRYDTDTQTAAEPIGVRPGDRYTFETFVPSPSPSQTVLDQAAAGDASTAVVDVASVLQADATAWSASANTPYERVMAIATHLHNTGYFSDGLEDPTLSVAGHSEGRLTRFLQGGGLVGNEIVGDGEQYAATFALMARSIGVPARVVLGAKVGPGGVVKGSDVEPWVEIDLANVGWVPIYVDSFMDRNRTAHQTPPSPAPNQPNAAPVQPPVVSALHAPLEGGLPGNQGDALSHFAPPAHNHFHLPGWLVAILAVAAGIGLAVALFAAVVLSLKGRRRRARRASPTTAGQIAGAWKELIDACTDLGRPVPAARTRREQAAGIEGDDVARLAVRGDFSVFGPDDPSTAEVSEYWSATDRVIERLRSDLSRTARFRTRLSLRSVLPARRALSRRGAPA